MDVCEVCLENNGELSSRIFINSKKWIESNIQNLIEKHFWWWALRQPMSKEHIQWICQQCWQELTSFHQFCQRIKKSHKLYRSSIKKQNIYVCNEAEPNQMAVAEQGSSSSGQGVHKVHTLKNMQTDEVHIKKEPYFEMDDESQLEPNQIVMSELGATSIAQKGIKKETDTTVNADLLPIISPLKRKNIQMKEVHMEKEPTYMSDESGDSDSMPQNNLIFSSLDYSTTHVNDHLQLNNSEMLPDNSLAEIKYLIAKQNINLSNMLAEQTENIKTIISSFWQPSKYITLFPIKTVEELIHWENTINEDNKQEMIKAVTTVMGEKGIVKGLPLIISQNVMIDFNLEGLHNKKRLKNYTQIMDVLFYSFTTTSIHEKEPQTFESELRKAFKNAKNRHFKDTCIKNKKLKLEETTFTLT